MFSLFTLPQRFSLLSCTLSRISNKTYWGFASGFSTHHLIKKVFGARGLILIWRHDYDHHDDNNNNKKEYTADYWLWIPKWTLREKRLCSFLRRTQANSLLAPNVLSARPNARSCQHTPLPGHKVPSAIITSGYQISLDNTSQKPHTRGCLIYII